MVITTLYDSVVIFTQNLSGAKTSPLFASFTVSSSPGFLSNSKFMIIADKNVNNESIATASPKQTLGPILERKLILKIKFNNFGEFLLNFGDSNSTLSYASAIG